VTLVWVLDRRDPRWRGAIDKRTAQFFAFWFGFCVLGTITDLLPIANFAHAGGAVFGGLIGWAMTTKARARAAAITSTVASFGVFVGAATLARPALNISSHAGLDAMILAERAMDDDDLEAAITWAERGVGYWRTPAEYWGYLAWLYLSAERYADARDALTEAVERDPGNAKYELLLEQIKAVF
jgi:hypothetical protein